MKMDNNFSTLALVAIVAVVGVISLVMLASPGKAPSAMTVPTTTADAGNLGGQAISSADYAVAKTVSQADKLIASGLYDGIKQLDDGSVLFTRSATAHQCSLSGYDSCYGSCSGCDFVTTGPGSAGHCDCNGAAANLGKLIGSLNK